MRCAYVILLSVACPALQYFSHCLVNGTIFETKDVIQHEIYVSRVSVQILSEIFFILRISGRDMIEDVY